MRFALPARYCSMTNSLDPDTLTDPRDAAAYWFARERSGGMDETERQQFESWRRADPEHDREYRRAQGIWNATQLIPAERLRALAREPQAGALPLFQRRRLVIGLGTACTAAIVAGVTLPQWLSPPSDSQQISTGHGERRQVALPDDSIVDLNTDTALTVRFYAGQRVIELLAGEAAFSVTHDLARPFYVKAGDTTVRVTGTHFDVRRDDNRVRVAVASGSVEVRQGPWWNRAVSQLQTGQTVTTLAQGGLSPIAQMDVDAFMAWRQGRIVFRDTPLSQAIVEVNRYAPRPIQLNDAMLAQVHIAGVFSTDNTQAFLDVLPNIAPVRVLQQPDGTPSIARR